MDETKRSLPAVDRVELAPEKPASRSGTPRARRSWRKPAWYLACASSMLSVAGAEAQEPPPATAPSGETIIAPPPAVPPAPEPAPVEPPAPPPPPPPPIVLIAPAPPPQPPAVAVAVPVAPPPPVSPAWSPVLSGSYFTRYELRSGYDDLNISSATSRQRFLEGDAFFYRLRFGIGTGLLDLGQGLKVGLQFTPQATGTFGNLTSTPGAANTIIDANLGLHEGFARVQGAHARFDAGRFELNYGDGVLLGNLDWNEIGRSFDGARVRISESPTSAWLDVFATLLDEGRPDFPRGGQLDTSPGIGLGDTYLLGAYGAFGPAITKGLDLDAYSFVRAWGTAKNLRVTPANAMSPTYRRENATEATFGARAKQKIGLFDYRAEAGVQTGSRPRAVPAVNAMTPATQTVQDVNVLAYHADLELGVSFAEDKFRVALEGIYASGDDPSTPNKNEGFDELYGTPHKFLGLSDAFAQAGQKRTNVASGVLHLTAAATKTLSFQADGHIFARPERSAQFFTQRGFAGGEVDVAAVLLLAKGLKLRGTYAIFMPNSDLYHDVLPAPSVAKGADPVQFCEVELRYDLIP
jgi:hypothetical protein